MQAILVLHDIRSAQNVGSLFRTADAIGISKIYLSAITPAPIDRFGRPRSDIAKTALGAELSVPWSPYESLERLVEAYTSQGFQSVAIEQSEKAINYTQVPKTEKMLFILGNEVEGLPKSFLDRVSVVAEIPMVGKKESLNVSVAGGIALFRILE